MIENFLRAFVRMFDDPATTRFYPITSTIGTASHVLDRKHEYVLRNGAVVRVMAVLPNGVYALDRAIL